MPVTPLSSTKATQIAMIVRDIDEAAARYAALLGVPKPAILETQGRDKTNMLYRGRPSDARAKLAFFNLTSLSLELIQPIGGPSTWNDHLERHGESVHHIAFQVKDIPAEVKHLEAHGLTLVQTGDFTGGRYAYLEGPATKEAAIELLEIF
jgi:catechol 2,3-dioxygenase-like lactoylglutathione lyase family enzyme